MAKLCYRHTFIDEENASEIRRQRSWPQLSSHDTPSVSFYAGYVAELEGRCSFRQPVVAQALPEGFETAEVFMGPVPPVQPVGVEKVQAVSNHGSRAHPFLCNRPCVRFAKGLCESGDACGYCHHQGHTRVVKLDRRQRAQMKEMDTWRQADAR